MCWHGLVMVITNQEYTWLMADYSQRHNNTHTFKVRFFNLLINKSVFFYKKCELNRKLLENYFKGSWLIEKQENKTVLKIKKNEKKLQILCKIQINKTGDVVLNTKSKKCKCCVGYKVTKLDMLCKIQSNKTGYVMQDTK